MFVLFPIATSLASLSLVNEAQYLMINRASVELVHKIMKNRFEHHDVTLANTTVHLLKLFKSFDTPNEFNAFCV